MSDIDPDNVKIKIMDAYDYKFLLTVDNEDALEIHAQIPREDVIEWLKQIVMEMERSTLEENK